MGLLKGGRFGADVDALTWWDPAEDLDGTSAIDAHLVRVLRGA